MRDRDLTSHLTKSQLEQLQTIKAVGIDVDGTLLNSEHRMTRAVRRAVNAACEAGLKVHVITGRSLQTMRPVLEEKLFTDLMAVYGGAFIFDPVPQEIMDERLIPRQAAEILIDFVRSHRAALFVYFPDVVFVEAEPEQLEGYHPATAYRPVKTLDVLRERSGNPIKIAVYGVYDQLKQIMEDAREAGANLFYAFPHDYFMDVTHPESGKGDALRRLCGRTGVRTEEMLVIGDGENDLPMFAEAGVGVALANAAEKLKEAAGWIAPSNDDDGVAQVLDALLEVQSR